MPSKIDRGSFDRNAYLGEGDVGQRGGHERDDGPCDGRGCGARPPRQRDTRGVGAMILGLKRAILASFVVLWGVTPVALAAPRPGQGLGMPHNASEYGHSVDWLIHFTNICCAILFVIMCVWMGLAFLKHNRKHEAEYDHGSAKKQTMKAMLLSAVIFFIVDGTLWVNSTKDINTLFWNFSKLEQDDSAVRIEVNARQWLWQMRYAGADGKFNTADDALSDNELTVPVDTPVSLQLASPDVIHTFALPNFRIKQDAMPGMINRMWFQAKETGEFEVVCVQHCGVNHYKMKAILKVVPKDEFQRWLDLSSRDGLSVWDPKDTEAHWGWAWKKI